MIHRRAAPASALHALLGIALLALFERLLAGAAQLRRVVQIVPPRGTATTCAPDPHTPSP